MASLRLNGAALGYLLKSGLKAICEKGVIQPIVVRSSVNGRNLLAFGARRLRTAKLAALIEIPAVIRNWEADDFNAVAAPSPRENDLGPSRLYFPLLAAVSRAPMAPQPRSRQCQPSDIIPALAAVSSASPS